MSVSWCAVLLSVLWVSSSLAQPNVLTCERDQDCIDAFGFGEYCCARVNREVRDVHECKPIGQEGEVCHVGSNYLPYPFNGTRLYWRCLCNFPESYWCAPNSPGSLIDRCTKWSPPTTTPSTTTDGAASG